MGNRYSRAIVFVCSISASNLFAQRVIPKLKRPTSEVETAVETPTPEVPDATVLVSTNSQALVPRLIKFSGTLENLAGKPVAGTVDVTFSLYADETGGSPLWFETQTVEADSLGRYTVLLGAMSPAGVPMELFTENLARWLGVQVSNLPEQPRILLVSVPYALKAGDAETLGGKPASAYMLSAQAETNARAAGAAGTLSGLVQASALTTRTGSPAPQTVTATQNYIPMMTDNSGSLGNSMMYESGGFIGIGTTTPAFPFDLNNNVFAIGPKTSRPGAGGTMRFRNDAGVVQWSFGMPGTAGATDFFLYNNVNGHAPFYIQSGAASYSLYMNGNGNVGIGTTSPAQKLDVAGNVNISGSLTSSTFAGNLHITGTGNALIFPDGTVMTSAGAGTNGGTITGVTAGAGLTGGGTAGGVTLSMTPAACGAGQVAISQPLTCESLNQMAGANTAASGEVLTANGSGGTSWVASGPNGQAEFHPNGTYQFTVPAGVTRIRAFVYGAGGGAGASEDPSSIGGPGGGGASGEAVLSVTPGATLTIIVGAGGAGGTYNTTNSGSSGGTTEIEDQTNTVILSAGGGGGGSCGSCGAAVGAGGSTGIAPAGSILHSGPGGNECNNSGCPGYTPISFLNGDVRIGRAGFNNGTPSETETIGGVEGAVYIEW